MTDAIHDVLRDLELIRVNMSSRKSIIVGATGYIGKLLYNCASRNNDCTYGTSSSGDGNLLHLRLDAPDEFDYEIISPEDTVFLTAAISAPDICSREHDHAWAVNVTGTSEFITNVIKRGGRTIFFSSDTVYGERDSQFDENIPCEPAGDYAVMKYEVERRFVGDPQFKSIRLSYVFSREDKFTKYLSACAERGEEAEIFHPFYRAVIHRDDVVDGAIALAQRWDEFPNQIINFGGPDVLARTDFAKILQDTVLPSLRFKVTVPGTEFFKNRPKVIRMLSPVLEPLLERPAHTLREAANLEFERKVND